MSDIYPGIAIIGPTASGKSRMGILLAERFRGEIVGCDALQIYRHMDIGTGKVTAIERRGVPPGTQILRPEKADLERMR